MASAAGSHAQELDTGQQASYLHIIRNTDFKQADVAVAKGAQVVSRGHEIGMLCRH
jgi:sulfur carrier protein ThiS